MLVTLVDPEGSDLVNVQSVKCYLVLDEKKHKNRFPKEPYTDTFRSSSYNINMCGRPTYFVHVNNYTGFGVYPDWRSIYSCPCDEYLAPSKRTEDIDTIEVLFPAVDQRALGVYNLIVVAKLYEPGYGPDNTRTVTIDYPHVFELVKSTEETVLDAQWSIYQNVSPTTNVLVIDGQEVYVDTDKFPIMQNFDSTTKAFVFDTMDKYDKDDVQIKYSSGDPEMYIAVVNATTTGLSVSALYKAHASELNLGVFNTEQYPNMIVWPVTESIDGNTFEVWKKTPIHSEDPSITITISAV